MRILYLAAARLGYAGAQTYCTNGGTVACLCDGNACVNDNPSYVGVFVCTIAGIAQSQQTSCVAYPNGYSLPYGPSTYFACGSHTPGSCVTASPTRSPSARPAPPTRRPSARPSTRPTRRPSAKPSRRPSARPRLATAAPSAQPGAAGTQAPTTVAPTRPVPRETPAPTNATVLSSAGAWLGASLLPLVGLIAL